MFGNLNNERKTSQKTYFLKNVKILLKGREDVLNGFKSNIFLINQISDTTLYPTPDSTPHTAPDTTSRHTRSETSRLNENFIDEIINDEKDINSDILRYSGHQNSSLLATKSFKSNQFKNSQIMNQFVMNQCYY